MNYGAKSENLGHRGPGRKKAGSLALNLAFLKQVLGEFGKLREIGVSDVNLQL